MIETQVEAAMTEEVRTVTPDLPVIEAAQSLIDDDIGSVPVVDDTVVGILTESDLVRALADEATDAKVADYMSAPVDTVAPEASLEAAADRMRESNIKKLPVVDDGDLVGIVTTTDLAHFLPRYKVEAG